MRQNPAIENALPSTPLDAGAADPISCLLDRARTGDRRASIELVAVMHDYLRRLAQRLSGEPGANGPQPSTLVQETAARLLQRNGLGGVTDRTHLYWHVAKVMRTSLCTCLRRQNAVKRGGGWARVPLSAILDHPGQARSLPLPDFLDLHDILDEFERRYERACAVVTLRFLAGFTAKEVAQQLEVSERTVFEDWEFARAWLRGRLGDTT